MPYDGEKETSMALFRKNNQIINEFFCHRFIRGAYNIEVAMDKKITILVVGLCAVALMVGILSWRQASGGSQQTDESLKSLVATPKKQKVGRRNRPSRNSSAIAMPVKRGHVGEKPNVLADVDEADLTELAREVLLSLQQALDDDDYSGVKEVLSMCQNARSGELSRSGKIKTDLIPVLLRRKLVEAMGWFGAEAIPELIGFIADADDGVAQMSKDQFQLALEDTSLSDLERARIVSLAAQAVTDSDFLEQIFAEINDMRHSVGASTLVDICQNGTEAAKALMPDAIEFFTGEDNIKTVEDVEKWLEENPDGPDDDDLYGGIKDE